MLVGRVSSALFVAVAGTRCIGHIVWAVDVVSDRTSWKLVGASLLEARVPHSGAQPSDRMAGLSVAVVAAGWRRVVVVAADQPPQVVGTWGRCSGSWWW